MSLVKLRTAVIAVGLAGAAMAAGAMPLRVEAFTPALNGVDVQTLVVSPAYSRTGVVIAIGATAVGCKTDCYHMWISHDRGASWQQAAGKDWSGGNLAVAVDSSGKEVMFTGNANAVQRSDDLGATWSNVGAGGNPAVSPSFASDHLMAVAGKTDYTIRGTTTQNVTGSGGTMNDGYWSVMPGFPADGSNAPVFLGGIDNAGKANVEHCSASFSCSTPIPLPVADAFAGPPLILPSTGYAQDRTVFAHTAEGIFKSTDGGTTFTPVTPPVAGATHVATAETVLSPSYRENGPDRRVWAAVEAIKGTGKDMTVTGDLYSSTDGGATWKGVGSPGPFDRGAISVAVAPDGRIFGGIGQLAGGGLLCSTDGKVWVAYCPGPGANANGTTQGHTSGCGGTACSPGASVNSQSTGSAAGATAPPAQASSDPALAGSASPGSGNGSSSGKVLLAGLLGGLAVLLAAVAGVRSLLRRRRPATG